MDPLARALARAQAMVDKVDDVDNYKAVNALLSVLQLIFMEMSGQVVPPGAKAMSLTDLQAMVEKNKVTTDEKATKTDARLEEIRKNNYL